MTKEIEPRLKFISEYLTLKRDENFVIPEYQRGYSWSKEQCDKLWQDIEVFSESGEGEPYFFGTIIVDCSENKISLIDGQQRTTTFLVLLKALLIRLMEVLDKFEKNDDSEALEEGLKENRNTIIGILYKADVEKRIEILKNWDNAKGISILENNSINEQYKDEVKTIIEAKDFSEAESSVHRIPRKQKDNKYTNYFRNFNYFYEKLKLDAELLNDFAEVFLGECQIIEIRSGDNKQAITMFNSLNATGLPLSHADVISAKLYSKANDKEEFNEQWEHMRKLANNLNAQNIVNIDEILQQYMYIDRAKKEEESTTLRSLRWYYIDDPEKSLLLLKEPLELCAELQKIAEIWDKIKDYPIIQLLLNFNDNAKLFLLGYLYRFNPNDITQEKTVEIAECLLRLFTLLELVESVFSSKYFKVFLFKENVKLVDSKISIEEIQKDFNQHISNNWDEESIGKGLLDYDKNVLVYLNEYLYAKSIKDNFNFAENVNIEHIMPGSGRNKYSIMDDANITGIEEFNHFVNKLGNKILLEENINKSLGNDWFRDKKQKSVKEKSGYKDSDYAIAKSLTELDQDTWTKEDIETATQKASDRIVKFIFNQ